MAEFDISGGSIKSRLISVRFHFIWQTGASSHMGANVVIGTRYQSATWRFCADTSESVTVGILVIVSLRWRMPFSTNAQLCACFHTYFLFFTIKLRQDSHEGQRQLVKRSAGRNREGSRVPSETPREQQILGNNPSCGCRVATASSF